MYLTGGHILWRVIKILSLFSSAALESAFRVRTSYFFLVMTLKQRCSPSRSETSCSAQWVVRTHIDILQSSERQHLVCGSIRTLWAREWSSWGAERCVWAWFFSGLKPVKGGKSHSCEFFQLQVSLAENSRQQRTSKALFHTLFQLNSSLYGVGFGTAFVRLWVTQKMKTSQSFKRFAFGGGNHFVAPSQVMVFICRRKPTWCNIMWNKQTGLKPLKWKQKGEEIKKEYEVNVCAGLERHGNQRE